MSEQRKHIDAKEINALLEISKAIASGLYLEDVLRLIVTVTANLMDSKICSLWILDAKEQKLKLKATQSISEEYLKERSLAMGEGVVGHVALHNQPMAILNVLKEPLYKEKELAKKPDVETICSLKELATGKIEAKRRLDDLNERLKRCNKPCLGTVEACITQAATCNLYRVKSSQFDAAIEKGEDVLAKFAVIDQKCADPSVVSLTEIISLAKETQQLGEEFLNLRKLAIN